jgi:hypothetical protein
MKKKESYLKLFKIKSENLIKTTTKIKSQHKSFKKLGTNFPLRNKKKRGRNF